MPKPTPGEKITPNDFFTSISIYFKLITLFILWIFVKFNYLSVKWRNAIHMRARACAEGAPSKRAGRRGNDCTRNLLWLGFVRSILEAAVVSVLARSCAVRLPARCSRIKFLFWGKVSASSRVFLVIIQAQDNERNSKMDNWLIRERELDEVWSKWLINKCFGVDLNYLE